MSVTSSLFQDYVRKINSSLGAMKFPTRVTRTRRSPSAVDPCVAGVASSRPAVSVGAIGFPPNSSGPYTYVTGSCTAAARVCCCGHRGTDVVPTTVHEDNSRAFTPSNVYCLLTECNSTFIGPYARDTFLVPKFMFPPSRYVSHKTGIKNPPISRTRGFAFLSRRYLQAYKRGVGKKEKKERNKGPSLFELDRGRNSLRIHAGGS